MARIKYKDINLNAESLDLVDACRLILRRYAKLGMRVTLRQLYYQLVVINKVPNTERSYKRVGRILSDARISGLIDWDAVEDRARRPTTFSDWETVNDFMQDVAPVFRLPRRAEQPTYLELWVEKDALANVLHPLASAAHIVLSVNRGYSSSSAMHEAAYRIIRGSGGCENAVVLYLGDHDPSGEDMVRDIRERLELFRAEVEVFKVALTMDQIDTYKPPPNPAKTTDSRYEKYAEEHGSQSWEVDALPPNILADIVRDAIAEHTNEADYQAVVEREKALRDRIRSFE